MPLFDILHSPGRDACSSTVNERKDMIPSTGKSSINQTNKSRQCQLTVKVTFLCTDMNYHNAE